MKRVNWVKDFRVDLDFESKLNLDVMWCAMLCHAMLFHAIPCYSMLFHAIPCHDVDVTSLKNKSFIQMTDVHSKSIGDLAFINCCFTLT